MNKKWKYKGIGEICHLINGRAFKPSDWSPDGLRIIRIQNLNDNTKQYNCFNGQVSDKHLVNDGTVLLSWSGTPGTSFGCFIWNQGEAVLNQHIFKVLVKQDFMTDDFFTYAVNSQLDEMIRQAHGGVGLRHITKKKLEAMQIPVPPLSEQRRIVVRIKECFERVDEISGLRIESSKEAINLERAFFSDFLNEIDAPTVPLGEVVSRIQYGTSGKANTNKLGIPLLRMGNIKNGYLDVSDLKYIELSKKDIGKYALNEGDILFNRTNSLELVGKAAVFKDFKDQWVFASYLIRLEIDQKKAIPDFICGLINSHLGRDFIIKTARRAIGMVNINAKEIQSFLIPLPDLSDQNRIIQKINNARPVASEIRNYLNDGFIEKLPSAILQKAFSGEL
ncbi:MAG: restriction endonuclease subunit S [Deltaproteobacteria bacterium]|nr:restriction endonuclease subunit S [Deltaproteobacteria bacterium]